MSTLPRGVSAAMITAYREDGDIDAPAMGRLGRWLMSQGCDSLLVFGTTGEGPSVAVQEKIATVRAMIGAGIPARALIVGVGSPCLTDAVALTAALGEMGSHALVLPPYFFRAAPRLGVHAFMDELLRRTRTDGTSMLLYHFVEMSTVAVDRDMMATLMRDHPGRMTGVKDSSGDEASVCGWATRFPDLAIFAGDDHLLRPLLNSGGAGLMTATTGLAPGLVRAVFGAARRSPDVAPPEEGRLNTLWKDILLTVPVTEAVKLIFADVTGDVRWQRVRPPLRPLDGPIGRDLLARFRALDDGSIAAVIRSVPAIFS